MDDGPVSETSPHADAVMSRWLTAATRSPGPWRLHPLIGGNSNETSLLSGAQATFVLRRPPRRALSASAHSMAREHRLLTALVGTRVPAPAPVALCEAPEIPFAPFLVMQHIPDAVSITETLPPAYVSRPDALTAVADEVVDALAAVHQVNWEAVGLQGFGRPESFLSRQVSRWHGQWQKVARRPLPAMDTVAGWLESNRPPDQDPSLIHGDFHLDNCLFSVGEPQLAAVIDWEMATIGDGLLDLGLLLALWGDRGVAECAMPKIQAVSRSHDAPSRAHLLDRYEQAVGTRLDHMAYYLCLALFKLAAITEAAYSQHLAGKLPTEYAAALEHDVPTLLAEASLLCHGASVS